MKNDYNGERFLPEECKGEMAIEHYQRYQLAKQFVAGKIVLDAACGEGYGSSLLAENAACVTGLDIDADVVDRAKKKYGNEKLSYITGSIEKLPFEDHTIDVVISFETIEHVSEAVQKKFLLEIVRVLKTDGVLVMSTPNKRVYTDLVKGNNPFHVKEFYVSEYIKFIEKSFVYNEFFCQYLDTGYFIARANEKIITENENRGLDNSRYIISVSSNCEMNFEIETKMSAKFDDSMYYFLNLKVHELEQTILEMKNETDRFEKQQDEQIKQQQEYIRHLEKDIKELKDCNTKLHSELKKTLRGFIKGLNNR